MFLTYSQRSLEYLFAQIELLLLLKTETIEMKQNQNPREGEIAQH